MLKISIHVENMLFLGSIMLKIETIMSKIRAFMLKNVQFMLKMVAHLGVKMGSNIPHMNKERGHIAPLKMPIG